MAAYAVIADSLSHRHDSGMNSPWMGVFALMGFASIGALMMAITAYRTRHQPGTLARQMWFIIVISMCLSGAQTAFQSVEGARHRMLPMTHNRPLQNEPAQMPRSGNEIGTTLWPPLAVQLTCCKRSMRRVLLDWDSTLGYQGEGYSETYAKAQHVIVELACFADSIIGQLAPSFGSKVVRIGLDVADLSTKKGLMIACSIVRQYPGCDLWAAIPCTSVSSIQNANVAKFGEPFVKRLQLQRRYMLRIFNNFTIVAKLVLFLNGTVSYEWPRNCHGWKLEEVHKFFAGMDFLDILLDGCALGLTSSRGLPLKKPWKIKTTCRRLWQALHGMQCLGCPLHDSCHGAAAAASSRYTGIMARLIIDPLRQDHLTRPLTTRSDVGLPALSSGDLLGLPCATGDPVLADPLDLQDFEAGLTRVLMCAAMPCSQVYTLDQAEATSTTTGRQRDIFPLPHVSALCGSLAKHLDTLSEKMTNACISALNTLYRDCNTCDYKAAKSSPSKLQCHVLSHIVKLVSRQMHRLSLHKEMLNSWRGSYFSFEPSPGLVYCPLDADKVDNPSCAATCNPLDYIDQSARECLVDAARISPNQIPGQTFPVHAGDDLPDYVRIVAQELISNKVQLRTHILGHGELFARTKTSGRHRLLWNGKQVSETASDPPKPSRLANPASFVDIETCGDQVLYYSKRDASCYFDTLQAPDQLIPYFGRSGIAVGNLMKYGGWTLAQVASFVFPHSSNVNEHTILYPVSRTWPQGFSWSSYVAQENTLACCRRAGIDETCILSLHHQVPENMSQLVAVCTDDIILFNHDKEAARDTTLALDKSMLNMGIQKNDAKDVDAQLCASALGCELSNSPAKAEPSASRVASCTASIIDLILHPFASPTSVNSILGVLQWFCLMQRCAYSVFDCIYSFVRLDEPDVRRVVPSEVLNELLMSVCLLPLMTADFSRPWHPEFTACDASGAFGFGVSVAKASVNAVSEVGRLADKRCDFVRVFPSPDDPLPVLRAGVLTHLPVATNEFVHVIASRARWPAHSSILEAHALKLAIKYHSRRAHTHGSRLCVLGDARAILCAAIKGRSSARAIRPIMRAIAALSLACNYYVKLLYIPSESNPSDAPSRGKHRHRNEGSQKRATN